MNDRRTMKEKQWGEAVNESVIMSQKDHRDLTEDAEKKRLKYNFLAAYTKANKEARKIFIFQIRYSKTFPHVRGAKQLLSAGFNNTLYE